MALPRLGRCGRRSWLTLVTLVLSLVAVVGFQASSSVASADLTKVSANSDLSPSLTTAPASDTSTTTIVVGPGPVARPAAPVASAPHTPSRAAAHPNRAAKPRPVAKPRRSAPSDVCSGPGWAATRGRLALASLRDSGQRSGVTVSFQGAKSGYLGLTYPARHHVDVFVRSCGAESSTLLRHVISHEMGHAYDAAHMTTALRAQYKAMRGIPAATPWFGCSYCTDFKTPAGDFAETYSQWQRSSHDSRTQMAPMPGPAQLAAVAAAFFQG